MRCVIKQQLFITACLYSWSFWLKWILYVPYHYITPHNKRGQVRKLMRSASSREQLHWVVNETVSGLECLQSLDEWKTSQAAALLSSSCISLQQCDDVVIQLQHKEMWIRMTAIVLSMHAFKNSNLNLIENNCSEKKTGTQVLYDEKKRHTKISGDL